MPLNATPPRALQRLLRSEAGFSLTELMVVIVIIGILAMIAIPKFMNVTREAKMTEAKMMLRQVHALEQAYFHEHDAYASDLGALGFEQARLQTDGGSARYAVRVESATAGAYVATATAVVDFDQDGTFNVWEVGQTGQIKQRTAD